MIAILISENKPIRFNVLCQDIGLLKHGIDTHHLLTVDLFDNCVFEQIAEF